MAKYPFYTGVGWGSGLEEELPNFSMSLPVFKPMALCLQSSALSTQPSQIPATSFTLFCTSIKQPHAICRQWPVISIQYSHLNLQYAQWTKNGNLLCTVKSLAANALTRGITKKKFSDNMCKTFILSVQQSSLEASAGVTPCLLWRLCCVSYLACWLAVVRSDLVVRRSYGQARSVVWIAKVVQKMFYLVKKK